MRKIPPYTLTCCCTLAILYLTLVPKPLPDNDIRLFEHADKVVHAIMFGTLYLCLYTDDRRRNAYITAPAMLVSAVGVILFGGLIEVLQDLMAMGRGGDILDFLADAVGVILALTGACLFRKRRKDF